MKKFLLALILTGLLVAPIVLATRPVPREPVDISPIDALVRVTNWAFAILMTLAVLMLIISGIMFVTARGDENQLKQAKSILTFAIIGVVVALLARGGITFIERVLLGGT